MIPILIRSRMIVSVRWLSWRISIPFTTLPTLRELRSKMATIENDDGVKPSSFSIVAIFDRSSRNVGNVVNGMEILHDNHLTDTIIRERIRIGIIATPKTYA